MKCENDAWLNEVPGVHQRRFSLENSICCLFLSFSQYCVVSMFYTILPSFIFNRIGQYLFRFFLWWPYNGSFSIRVWKNIAEYLLIFPGWNSNYLLLVSHRLYISKSLSDIIMPVNLIQPASSQTNFFPYFCSYQCIRHWRSWLQYSNNES